MHLGLQGICRNLRLGGSFPSRRSNVEASDARDVATTIEVFHIVYFCMGLFDWKG
jgi:hypothetical protein